MNVKNGNSQFIITRSDRGLTIAGTRTTLYEIMDYLRADWPPTLIQNWLALTETQLNAALQYIETHREEMETEYRLVLREADETQTYWEEKNRQRFAQIAEIPPPPGKEALYQKIKASKAELGMA